MKLFDQITTFFLLFCICLDCAEPAIEVIGTGYPRTGTDTLKEALNILGYKTYHMKEIVMNNLGDHLDIWMYQLENDCNAPDSEELFKKMYSEMNFTATVGINFPCSEKLMQVFPDAKIIHTQRTNADLWHDSVLNSMCIMHGSWIGKIASWVSPFMRKLFTVVPTFFGSAVLGDDNLTSISPGLCRERKEQMIASYNAHNDKILKIVPPERLLIIINHKDGWKPLCEFLDKPIPDVPYPRANSRAEFKKLFKAKIKKALVFLAEVIGGIGTVCLVVYVAVRARKEAGKSKSD